MSTSPLEPQAGASTAVAASLRGDPVPLPSWVPGHPTLADQVAAAVCAVPGVVGMQAGAFGEAATYLPGRRVEGVQIHSGTCSVHVVLAWGAPVLATADLVRAVVGALVTTIVDVTVDDVAAPLTLAERAER